MFTITKGKKGKVGIALTAIFLMLNISVGSLLPVSLAQATVRPDGDDISVHVNSISISACGTQNVTITGTASYKSGYKLEVKLDGNVIYSPLTQPSPWSVTANSVAPGNHTVVAKVYKNSDSDSDSETFTIKTCPTLTVKKHVVNNSGGVKNASDFTMNVTGTDVSNPSFPGSESGTTVTLKAGSYSVDEVADAGYAKSKSNDCSGTIADGQSKTCTITNDDIKVPTGSITVCKIILDANGNVITGTPGTTFTIPWLNTTTSQGASATPVPASTVFNTALTLNTHILSTSNGNDAQCVTMNGLAVGNYYYDQEAISPNSSLWKTPKYSDEFTIPVTNTSSVFSYSGELFDGNSSNDGDRNQNADGHIVLSDGQSRRLIIVNQLKPVETPTFSIKVTKLECPADTQVSRGANGPDSDGNYTAPQGCTLKSGVNFGYFNYPSQTTGGAPYAYNEAFTLGGATDGSGVVIMSGLPKVGRYDVAELDAQGARVPDMDDDGAAPQTPNNILGLYCNTDTGKSTDNLDYVIAGQISDSQADCVVYNVKTNLPLSCNPDQELLTNGGFETPTVTDVSGWDVFPSGTSGLGWIVNWLTTNLSAPLVANIELQKNVASGWTASEGNQYTELDSDWNGHAAGPNGEEAAVAISQDIPTIPGKKYHLSFDFSPRPDTGAAENKLEVIWGGLLGLTVGPVAGNGTNTTWTSHTVDFTATTSSTRITFRDAGTPNDSLGTFVDNASLKCMADVPQCDPEHSDIIVSDTSTQVDSHDAVLVDPIHPRWTASVGSVDAEWIWSENPIADAADETKTFTKTFNITGTPLGATLTVAADNGFSALINGQSFSCADPEEFNYQAGHENVCPIAADLLNSGSNTLSITVNNMGVGNMPGNPAGLLYKLVVNSNQCENTPPPEIHTSTVTMCKVDTNQHALSGWTLMLSGNDKIGSDIPVNSASQNPVFSVPLASGTSYIAKVSGVWNNQGGANPADAEYSTLDSWVTHMQVYGEPNPPFSTSDDVLDLRINDQFEYWGAYNSNHNYAVSFIPGSNGPVSFGVYDGQGNVQNPSWFTDNNGLLNVSIYQGYAGITGGNGCVTFSNVPYGSYTSEEIMQDGWTNQSGLGPVTINEPTETITVVNKQDEEQCPIGKHFYGEGCVNNDPTCTGNTHLENHQCVNNDPTCEGDTHLENHECVPNGGDDDSVDVCNNIQGDQSVPPEGQHTDQSGACVNDNPTITTNDNPPSNPPSNGPVNFSFGGGGGGVGNGAPQGQVLGASCGLYMDKHIKFGSSKNDSEQVKKLQAFLNKWLGKNLPITGFYGPLTLAAVNEFQAKYGDDVLKPWNLSSPTGLVYLSTLKQINKLECPDLSLELPPLVPWSQNPNAQ